MKQCRIGSERWADGTRHVFLSVIEEQGFQLPTVSALFHFCYPNSFPIVDRYVAAACAHLHVRCKEEFGALVTPKLPDTKVCASRKLERYERFIAFIDRIRDLQVEYGKKPSYRFTDRALMVLGSGIEKNSGSPRRQRSPVRS